VVALARVMAAVLPVLPTVRPVSRVTLSMFQPEVLKPALKLVPLGSMTSLPGPENLLEAVVGASFWKTRVPALMVVLPV